jgi:hypothetical protein
MLIQCPECKQQISDQAESCPKCGRPISSQDREKARAAAKASQNVAKGCGIGCLVVVVIIILIAVFSGQDTSHHAPSGGTRSSPSDKKIEAWVMAQQFVKKQLRAPATASFGSVFGDYQDPDEHVTLLADGRYQVSGWVDAENAFGAKIRNDFFCVLRDVGDGSWRCEQITVTGR